MAMATETESTAETIPVSAAVVKPEGEEVGPWERRLEISISAAEVDKVFNKAVAGLAHRLRLPGFRPGKVPRALVEKRFTKELAESVKEDLVARGLRSALEKEKLDAVGAPRIKLEEIKPLRGTALNFAVDLELRPEFELPKWRGLPVEQEEAELFPAEIEQVMENLRSRNMRIEDAPEGAAAEPREISFVGGVLRVLVEGKEVHKEDDAQLLLTDDRTIGAWLKDLKDDFVKGVKVGERRTAEGELPETFPVEEARGKKAVVELEVRNLRRRIMPSTEQLAKEMGFESVEQLQEKVREQLTKDLTEKVKKEVRDSLLERLVEAVPFELPKHLTERFAASYASSQMDELRKMGLKSEDLDEDKIKPIVENTKKEGKKLLRQRFILEALCKAENIKPTEEEVDEEIVRRAQREGKRPEVLYRELKEDRSAYEALESGLAQEKAVELLVENAEVKIVPRKPPTEQKKKEDAKPEAAGADAKAEGPAAAETNSNEQPTPADAAGKEQEETPAETQ